MESSWSVSGSRFGGRDLLPFWQKEGRAPSYYFKIRTREGRERTRAPTAGTTGPCHALGTRSEAVPGPARAPARQGISGISPPVTRL